MEFGRRDLLKLGTTVAAATCGIAQSRSSETAVDPIDLLAPMTNRIEPIPRSEYAQRRESLRVLMARERVGALILEPGSDLLYFGGVSWGLSERVFAMMIPDHGSAIVVCPAFEEERARERIPSRSASVRVWQEHENPYQLLAQAVKEAGIRGDRIAVGPSTRQFVWTGLEEALSGRELIDGSELTVACRIRKSRLEISNMELADQITKRAYDVAFAGLKEGLRESELRERISRAHSRLGVRGGALVLFGPNSALPHGSRRERVLREGDVVLVDGGGSVNGYRSDVTRTVIFGEPNPKHREVWEIVYQAQSSALNKAGPGVPCEEVDRVARQLIASRGFGPGYRFFTHRLGHGIGLDGHEHPYLVKGNRRRLEVGMTMSNEPGIYLPGEWGIRHEDIMVITAEGARFFGKRTEPTIA
jgi:Xaa-Pro dipeptidase